MRKLIVTLSMVVCVSLGLLFSYSHFIKNNTVNAAENSSFQEYTYAESSSGASIKIKNPKSLDEVINYADLIIKGEVIAVKDVSSTYTLQPNTPEKKLAYLTGGSNTFTVKGTEYTIKISDTIKGSTSDNVVTLYRSMNYDDISPQLSQGDNYVFFLNWKESLGKYIDGHPTASYYKIDKDQKITPMYKGTSEFSDLESKSFDTLKNKLVEKAKN